MSSYPTDAQRSAISHPARSSPSPRLHHGSPLDPRCPLDAWAESIPSGGLAPAGSAPASTSGPHVLAPANTSESAVPAGGNSYNSTRKVIGSRVSGTKKVSCCKKSVTASECQLGREEAVSQFRSNQFGSSQGNERPPATAKFVHSENLATKPSGLHGNAGQSATRRNNVINANHLLNFYYDPISRSEPRIPSRRQQKIKPYNKDLFLQANYKFVVLDRGGCEIKSMDPDKMLHWEDVICVRYSTPLLVQCPICLEIPLCPQLTSCGHIYCFPCILRYMLMGEENHKGECWKKCPLCFTVISTKDLYTVLIENVKQFGVGDHAHFTLLTRPKVSVFPVLKKKQVESSTRCATDGLCDSFSKFVLTSDVELSVREAKSDLYDWLHKADSGLVEDLEKLPYVCAALEQLDERMKAWMEQQTDSTIPLRDHVTPSVNSKTSLSSKNRNSHALNLTSNLGNDESYSYESGIGMVCYIPDHEKTGSSIESAGSTLLPFAANSEQLENSNKVPLSHNEDESFQREEMTSQRNSHSCSGGTERDSYTFYQATDGQHLILHPLNMKCLLHHYGSYDLLPPSISGEILELETVTQSEAMRRRYRYLSHFSLTTTFQLCEIDLRDLLPSSSLVPFLDEMKKREKQRRRLARKERDERARAEAASVQLNLISSARRQLTHKDVVFSSDDFEALGANIAPSSSPPTGERKLFSDVTRLGFAAAHDSPSLRAEESADASAPRLMTTSSFATILSSACDVESSEHQTSALGKKGKKPNRVLLSTASSRRY
ncbi:RING [Musa troglodytarum]|uniref:RING n=1 Tax=Musa troglodytarum TaxID=320322 RepID=A0A9E7GKN5_9LILI|nr:RING [Musa troglodytarum]